jgi:hypothetical protein
MELGGSLPHSRQPATCTYPKPYQFSPWPQSHCLKIHFNIVLLFVPRTSSGLFPSGFPTKTLHSPVLYLVVLHVQPISVSVAFTAPLLTNPTCDGSFRVCCSEAHVALAVCHTHCRTVSNLVLLYFKIVALKSTLNQSDPQDFEAYKIVHI